MDSYQCGLHTLILNTLYIYCLPVWNTLIYILLISVVTHVHRATVRFPT